MCDEKQNECRDHGDPPWEGPQVIPAQIRRVDNLIFRKINQFARANGVEQATPMHGWIIEYLYRHREEQVFQRDIEREFSITRSTVTNILQLMERKGYIRRQSVPQDADGRGKRRAAPAAEQAEGRAEVNHLKWPPHALWPYSAEELFCFAFAWKAPGWPAQV